MTVAWEAEFDPDDRDDDFDPAELDDRRDNGEDESLERHYADQLDAT